MAEARIGGAGQALLIACALFPVLAVFSFNVVLPQIAAAFPDNPDAVMLSQWVGAIVGFAFALGSPVMGSLVERHGYKRVLIWSATIFSLAGASVFWLRDIYLILASRVVLGAMVGGIKVAALSGIAAMPEKQRMQTFGFFSLVGGGLAIACVFIVGQLAAAGGWRLPFLIHFVGLAFVPLFALLLPAHAPPPVEHERPATAYWRLLPVPFLLLICFAGMITFIPGLFVPFYLRSIGVNDPELFAIPVMAQSAVAMLAAASYGWLQQRVGIRGVWIISMATVGLGFLAAGVSQNLVTLTMAVSFAGIGLTLCSPNINAASVAFAPHNHGRALGIANGILYGSQIMLPMIAKALNNQFGPAAVFHVYGIATAGAAALFLLAGMARRARTRPI